MSFDDSVLNDLGIKDNSGEKDDGFEKFLSKPIQRQYQPFGGPKPQTQSSIAQPQYAPQEPQQQAQPYQNFNDYDLDVYEQKKKQFTYVNQDASAHSASAKLYEDRYDDFVKTKFRPYYQSLGGFDGDFETDDDYASAIEDMYKGDLTLSQSEDGFFGESDEKKAARERLKGFTQWNSPNGLRDQFQRLKQEKEMRRALADRSSAQKTALMDQMTMLPRMQLDDALKARKSASSSKPRSRKATNEMLDQMQFEDPGMVNPETGLRSNLYRTDPRNKIKGMVNPETGKRSKDFYAQQDRMAAAMRGDMAGFMTRRESVAKDRQMRDRGMLFSQNGMLDGYPVGMSRMDTDILDIEKAQKMGIKEYKGRPIEEAFNELGGEERLNVAKIMNAVRSAYSNREKAQINWLAGNRKEDLKAPMEEANDSFEKALQLAAQFGLTDEIVEQTESKGFFSRMADSMSNAFSRGMKMNEMSKYADDFFLNAADQSEIEKFIQAAEELGEIPTSSAAKKFQNYKSKGFWDSVGNLLFDNAEAIPELFVESMSSFLPAYVRTGMYTIPGGAAAGGAAGLAGGPLAPATVTGGAFTGAGIAARLNWGTASMVLEYSGMVLQGMQELNIDWQNPKVFAAAWNNQITRDAIKDKALKKGLPIALLDSFSGMMGGKIAASLHHGGNAIKGGKLIDGAAWARSKKTYPKFTKFQRAGNEALEIGADAAAGMGGEFLGQAWSKEPGEGWDHNAIVAEGIIGLGPGLLGGAYEFSAKPNVGFEGTPFDYEGVRNTETGQTGTVNLAGFRNQFHSFGDARPAAAHVLNEGNYANAEAKDNATRVLTDIMGRLYAINPDAMKDLKIVVADRTPYADKEMEGSYHFDNETKTSVIYINRNKIGQDPLGVFLHEAGHLARHLMMDKAELINIYDSIGPDAQNDAFTQYTLKIPEIKYSQLDDAQKAQVDKAKNSKGMSKLRMAEEWFSYQWANLLAGHKVDPSVKTEYQNFLSNVIHPAMEKFIGGETTGGSKEQKFNFDQMILRKMGFNPDGTPKEGPKFGQYYQERAGMAERFFGNDMPIQQMGDEEALNHLMRKVAVIMQTEGEARAKQVAEATNKILGKNILPTEMSAYTNLEIQEALTPLGEDQIDAQEAVATAEVLETLEGKDAEAGVNELVEEVEVDGDTSTNVTETAELEKTLKKAELELQTAQTEFDSAKRAGQPKEQKSAGKRVVRAKQTIKGTKAAIEKAKNLPAKAKGQKVKVARVQKDIDKAVDQTAEQINQAQALMPGAEVTQKGDKFELRTRQPGTRKAGSAKTFDTKEAAEKAKEDFYKAELEKLKDTSQAVTNLKKLVLNEKEFEKEAAKVKAKLFKELQSKQRKDSKKELTEEDITFGQIIAEMMDLNGLQANAIFSSALAGDRLSELGSMKAPDGQRVVQIFEEYEQKVESASMLIGQRIVDLEKRKEAILNPEALGSAQAKEYKYTHKIVVVVNRAGNKIQYREWDGSKFGPKKEAERSAKGAKGKKEGDFIQKYDAKTHKYLSKKYALAKAAAAKEKGIDPKYIQYKQNKAQGAPAKKAAAKPAAKAKAEPKQAVEPEKSEKKELTKEQKAELTEINKKITMLKQYLDAIQPEKAAIDWKDTPHMTYHKYVGPKEEMSFKEENFERYTLGELASTQREDDTIWQKIWNKKRNRHEFVQVKGVSDTQDYLFKYTNWRLNEQGQAAKPEPKAEGQKPKANEKVERVNVTSVTKIISGGQTGADRAGLYAGKDLGVETGGVAPKGFKTESQSDETERLKGFGLTEVSDDITKAYTGGEKTYGPRTEQNVLGSDGTVLFGDENSSGSKLTKNLASKHKKPYLANPTAEELRAWIAENDIKTLNVAGNRYSVNKKLFNTVRSTLVEGLSDPKAETEAAPEPEAKAVDEEPALGSGLANPDQSQAFNPFINGRKLTDKLPWFGDKTVEEYLDLLDAVRASAAMPENVGERAIGKAVKSEGKEVGQKDRIYFQPQKGTTVAAMMLFRLKEMDRKSGVNSRQLINGNLDRVTLSEMTVYELATGRAMEILDDRDFRGSKQQRYHQVIERKASEMAKDIEAYEKLLAKTDDPKEKERIERILNGSIAEIDAADPNSTPGKDVKGPKIAGLRQQLAALIFDYDEIGAFQGEETGGAFAKIHGGKVWTETLTEFMFYREKADAVQTILDIWEDDIANDRGPGMGRKTKERKNAPEQGAIDSWLIYQALKRSPDVTREQIEASLAEFRKKAEEAKGKFEETYAEKAAIEETQAAKAWGTETVAPDDYVFFGPGEKATSKVKETSAHGSFARGAVDEGIPVLSMFGKGRADNFKPEKTTFGTGSGSEQANIGLAADLDRKVNEQIQKKLGNLLKRKESQNIDAFEITKPDGKTAKVKRVNGTWKKGNNHKLPKDLQKIAEDTYINSQIDVIDSVNKDIENMDADAIAGVSSGAHVSAVQLVEYLIAQVKKKGGGKDALKKVMRSLEWNPSSETKDGIVKQLPGGPAGGLLPYVWFEFITALHKKLKIKTELKLTEASDPAKSGWKNIADEMIRTVTGENGKQTRILEKNDLYKNGIPDMDVMVEMVKPIIQAVYNSGRLRLNPGRGFDETESNANSANASNILQRNPMLHDNPLDSVLGYEEAPEGSFDNAETDSATNKDQAKQTADDLEPEAIGNPRGNENATLESGVQSTELSEEQLDKFDDINKRLTRIRTKRGVSFEKVFKEFKEEPTFWEVYGLPAPTKPYPKWLKTIKDHPKFPEFKRIILDPDSNPEGPGPKGGGQKQKQFLFEDMLKNRGNLSYGLGSSYSDTENVFTELEQYPTVARLLKLSSRGNVPLAKALQAVMIDSKKLLKKGRRHLYQENEEEYNRIIENNPDAPRFISEVDEHIYNYAKYLKELLQKSKRGRKAHMVDSRLNPDDEPNYQGRWFSKMNSVALNKLNTASRNTYRYPRLTKLPEGVDQKLTFPDVIETIFHETVHVLTEPLALMKSAFEARRDNYSTVFDERVEKPKLISLVKELEYNSKYREGYDNLSKIKKFTQQAWEKTLANTPGISQKQKWYIDYFLSNEAEIGTMAFTNPEVADFLISVKLTEEDFNNMQLSTSWDQVNKPENLFQAVVNIILKALGYKKEDLSGSILERIMVDLQKVTNIEGQIGSGSGFETFLEDIAPAVRKDKGFEYYGDALGSSYSLSSGVSTDALKTSTVLTRMANKVGLDDEGKKALKDYFAKKKDDLKSGDIISSFVDQSRAGTKFISDALRNMGIEDQALLDQLDVRGLWHQYYGKTDEQVKQAEMRFIEPIMDALSDHGISQEEFGEYLIARMAPSRNIHLKKMYTEMMNELDDGDKKNSLKEMLEKRGDNLSGVATDIAIKVVKKMEAEPAFLNFLQDSREPLQKFYDMNLEGLKHRAESELIRSSGDINEAKAMRLASSFFNWKKDGGSKFSFKDNGKDDNYSYAPMQGFEGGTDTLYEKEEAYGVVGKSSSSSGRAWDQPKNKFLFKGAFGRPEDSVGPNPETVFAVAREQYFEGGVRGAKNEVSNSFGAAFELFRAVAYHGKEITEGEPLTPLPPAVLERIEKDPSIIETAREMFEGKDAIFEKDFKQIDIKKDYKIVEKDILVDGKKVEGLRMVTREINTEFQNDPYVFVYRKNGVPHYVQFKKDANGGRVARSIKNLRYEALPAFLKGVNSVTRFMASMFTSRNPAFIIPNFIRDLGTAFIHLSEDDKKKFIKAAFSPKRLKGFLVETMKVERKAYKGEIVQLDPKGLSTEEYAKKLIREGDYQRVYQLAKEAGAKVGYFRAKSVPELLEEMEKYDPNSKKGMRGAWNSFVNLLDVTNTGVENSIRMSAFASAVEAGYTVHQAASISRNVTVDFNQKGEMTQTMGSLFVFFGASMNSMHRMMSTFKKRSPAERKKLILTIAGASFGLSLFNRIMDDDEDEPIPDYDTISSYRRDTMAIVGDPRDKNTGYVGIPLPLGYNMFWALGQTAGDFFAKTVMGRGGAGPVDFLTRNLNATLNAFNPIGGSTLATAMIPTVGKPVAELWANQNFMDMPIRNEDRPYEAPKPAHMMDPKRTQEHWTALSEGLNNLLGGSDEVKGSVGGLFGGSPLNSLEGTDMKFDISGSQMEHLLLGYAGGPGQIANAMFGGLLFPAMSEEKDYGKYDPNKMPIANRFYRSTTHGSRVKNLYYQVREANKIADRAIKAAKIAGPKEFNEAQKNLKGLLALSSNIKYADAFKKKVAAQKSKVEVSKSLTQDQKLQRIAQLEQREHDAYVKVIKKAQSLGIS